MPAKLERCVKKVKAKGGVESPWAVCIAATGIEKKKGGGWTKEKHHSVELGSFIEKRRKL